MLKKEFVAKLSEVWEMPKKEVESKVNSVFDLITEVLVNKDTLTWFGFGRFFVRQKMARIGKNPLTGKVIQVPEKTVPVFKASEKLREYVQKGMKIMPKKQ